MPTRPTASCTDRSNSPLGELDEPCPTSQRRVGSTNPTRSSNSSLALRAGLFISYGSKCECIPIRKVVVKEDPLVLWLLVHGTGLSDSSVSLDEPPECLD
ncbi:hypothetical protein F2Q70_00004332 [Brassica cretica]|uniref:Uncharacterized protein n=1 Tax=Brassica cretica TaxID=69181 RepID=A0A8S9J121_BRACR|nr:hypothetical protein F2Q70_00004332 [Brassica cretica]